MRMKLCFAFLVIYLGSLNHQNLYLLPKMADQKVKVRKRSFIIEYSNA